MRKSSDWNKFILLEEMEFAHVNELIKYSGSGNREIMGRFYLEKFLAIHPGIVKTELSELVSSISRKLGQSIYSIERKFLIDQNPINRKLFKESRDDEGKLLESKEIEELRKIGSRFQILIFLLGFVDDNRNMLYEHFEEITSYPYTDAWGKRIGKDNDKVWTKKFSLFWIEIKWFTIKTCERHQKRKKFEISDYQRRFTYLIKDNKVPIGLLALQMGYCKCGFVKLRLFEIT